MKRNALAVMLLLAVSLAVLAQLSCATSPDTNRAAAPSASNTNSEREPVNTAAIETELLRIENDWPRVIREKDVAAVTRVEADDIVLIDPDGNLRDKAQDIKDIETGAVSVAAWEIADLKVSVLDQDAAFVSGRSVVKDGKYKMPDGKVINFSGQYRFIDTFSRRNGEWKLVAAASVPIKNPTASASPTPKSTPTPRSTPTPGSSPTPRTTPTPRPRPSPAGSPRPATSPAL